MTKISQVSARRRDATYPSKRLMWNGDFVAGGVTEQLIHVGMKIVKMWVF
tara:strand:- start:467 stop:616 length:150 start_codon:yes stop_codon:yes gene_type:complete